MANAGDLHRLIKQQKEDVKNLWTPLHITKWYIQIFDAMKYVHSVEMIDADDKYQKGICHRDVKPQNILLNLPEGAQFPYIVMGDFGLARSMDHSKAATSTRGIGTLPYFSPEQLEDEPYGMKSDVWALGCTLFETW